MFSPLSISLSCSLSLSPTPSSSLKAVEKCPWVKIEKDDSFHSVLFTCSVLATVLGGRDIMVNKEMHMLPVSLELWR